MAPPRKPLAERLAAWSVPDGECLVWTGNKGRDGYGVMSIGRKQYRAHRVAYAVANGGLLPEPEQKVCHRCDRPECINPEHLFLGTARDNTQDMIAKGRKARVIDAEHHGTKIRHAEREAIRQRKAQGQTLKQIASEYGVSFQTISDICRGARSYGAA